MASGPLGAGILLVRDHGELKEPPQREKNRFKRTKRHSIRRGVSALAHLSLASQANERRWFSPPLLFRLPGRLLPFEGRSLAVALAGRPVLLRLTGLFSSSRYITGADNLAIGVPFSTSCDFNHLLIRLELNCFDSGSLNSGILQKSVDERFWPV